MKQIIRELRRLVKNIQSGRFNRLNYKNRKKYYGLELEVDSFYEGGGFGMSVSKDGNFVTWVYYNPQMRCLNFGGVPCEKALAEMERLI